MKHFDVVVIGTGSAGASAAYVTNEAGKSVAIIETAAQFGGTCANRGCDPKKVLIAATEATDWVSRMGDKDVVTGSVGVNWPKLMEFKRTFTDPVDPGVRSGFKDAGIAIFEGFAKLEDEHTVMVDDTRLGAKYIVIATGAVPMKLNIPGEQHVTTSTDFLNLDSLPKRIVFIGGGFISFEFAHLTQRAGSQATILHRSQQVLKGFDPDLVSTLVDETKKLGVAVHINSAVEKVEKNGDELVVHSGNQTFPADLVVHGAGRPPAIEGMQLEETGIKTSNKGIAVNQHLQSNIPHIYAGGDVSDTGLPLTPVAGRQGEIIGNNIVHGNQMRFNARGVPAVVFTIPPLTTLGLQESQAKEKGLDYTVKTGDSSGWFSSRRINETSAFKVLVEKGSNKILGAHILGHHAEEVINIFAFAMRQDLPVDSLREIIYAYPTHASNIPYML